ncbi:MAG: hypothetical protein GX854_14400 [Clostridiales bacterium]|nr:hypothetical protein [Clostridiales bacterium]
MVETKPMWHKDEEGNPYIPATSFVGALRHYIEEHYYKNSSS